MDNEFNQACIEKDINKLEKIINKINCIGNCVNCIHKIFIDFYYDLVEQLCESGLAQFCNA